MQPYAPNPARTGDGARLLTNRSGYSLNYNGIELSAHKRLADKWMMRAAFSWRDWTEGLGDGAFQNPSSADVDTIIQGGYPGGAGTGLCGPCIDGGIIALKSYVAKTDVYFNAKWQFSANAMYQAPYGLEVAANVFGRQGYPFPIFRAQALGADTLNVLVSPRVDAFRLSNIWNTDVRIARAFRLEHATVRVIGDLFNDRVDKVWAPMEALYEKGHPSIPSWREGSTPEEAGNKANELVIPEGARNSLRV